MNDSAYKHRQPTEADHRQLAWGAGLAGEALALLIERARDFDDDQCEQFTLITLVIANMVKAASERATALGTLSVQQYCDHMKRMVNVIAEKSRNIQ